MKSFFYIIFAAVSLKSCMKKFSLPDFLKV